MKFSKKDFVLIDLLLSEKLKSLRLDELSLQEFESYMSSYDFFEEKKKIELESCEYIKIRNKILKMMED